MLLLLLLTVLASPAVSQSPLDGSYMALDDMCAVQLEIRYLNFVAMRGPCSDGDEPGVFIGTYDVQPDDPDATEGTLTLFYTTVIGDGPVAGQTYFFTWIKAANGNLNMSSPMFGGVSTLYMPVDSPLSGTWSLTTNQGINLYLDLAGATYMSYASPGSPNVSVSLGSYTLSSKKRIQTYYAYAHDGEANTFANGTYSLTNNKLSLNLYVEAKHETLSMNGMMTQANKILEGTWSGSVTINPQGAYCMNYLDIHGNFFRLFQTQCSPQAPLMFGTYLGNFQVKNDQLYLSYAFVDVNGQGDSSGLAGYTFAFTYGVTYGRLTTLVITAPGDQPVMTLTKTS